MPTGTITALRVQIRDSQRVNIFLDGEFVLGVSLTTLAREGLAVGQELDAAAWARLEASDQADQALQRAMRLLEIRPRSVAELRMRLQRYGLPPAAIEHALTRLLEVGLLDDAAFSRAWIENRRTFTPRGNLALRDELRRKGVAREIVESALADADEGIDRAEEEAERALAAARNVLHRYTRAPDRISFQRRLGGYLQRRGFTLETIRPILDQLWADSRNDSETP